MARQAVDDAVRVVEELAQQETGSSRKGALKSGPSSVMSLVFAAVAGLVVKSLPDIARYLKMREM